MWLLSAYDIYNKSKDINSIINSVSSKISERVFNIENNLEEIINNHGNHITIVSDLPIEWIKVDNTPLYIRKKISRLPITPADNLLSFVQTNREPFELSKSNLKILVLNALKTEDPLHKFGRLLYESITHFSSRKEEIIYSHAKSKTDYIKIIQEESPTILVHFGHGGYNRWNIGSKDADMNGFLDINGEKLYPNGINQITEFPKIVVLGACTTEVPQGPNYNIANTFLSNGALSVIGTFVPVNADYTVEFIHSLISNLYETLNDINSKKFETWSDAIYSTRVKHYIEEPIYCLRTDYRKGKFKSKLLKMNVKEAFLNYVSSQNLSLSDGVKMRSEIYRSIFSEDAELLEALNSIINSNIIAPYSSFYTSLGSPEQIRIVRSEIEFE